MNEVSEAPAPGASLKTRRSKVTRHPEGHRDDVRPARPRCAGRWGWRVLAQLLRKNRSSSGYVTLCARRTSNGLWGSCGENASITWWCAGKRDTRAIKKYAQCCNRARPHGGIGQGFLAGSCPRQPGGDEEGSSWPRFSMDCTAVAGLPCEPGIPRKTPNWIIGHHDSGRRRRSRTGGARRLRRERGP